MRIEGCAEGGADGVVVGVECGRRAAGGGVEGGDGGRWLLCSEQLVVEESHAATSTSDLSPLLPLSAITVTVIRSVIHINYKLDSNALQYTITN